MKYIFILALIILNPNSLVNAQKIEQKRSHSKKIIKEVSYRAENGELKNRENLFDSKISRYLAYDRNDKIIETRFYEIDGSVYEKVLYNRDKNGKAIRAEKKNSKNEIKSYWIYYYDSNNNQTKVKTYNSKDIFTKIQTNEYDKNGNNIAMFIKNPNEDKGWSYEYKYDSKNQKIEQIRYKPDGSVIDRRTYTYYPNGNEFEEFLFKSDGTVKKFVSEYDEMNNLISHNWFNSDGELTNQSSYEYIYDEHGNWITKKSFSDGEISMVYERLIEYYD